MLIALIKLLLFFFKKKSNLLIYILWKTGNKVEHLSLHLIEYTCDLFYLMTYSIIM